jgi:predicted transcriptional regulator
MATRNKITVDDFKNDPALREHIARGREVARALDSKAAILPYSIVLKSHEFGEFVSALTPKRYELLRLAFKGKHRSISELAAAVHREQSAVSKDVARLTELGLVKVEEVSNSGHGRKKIVVPVAETISINVDLADA